MVAVLTNTFRRPALLARLLQCFLNQTYKDALLFILDGSGEFRKQSGERWGLFHSKRPIQRIDEMYDYLLELSTVSGNEYVAYWDDDDIFFPRHLEMCVEGIGTADIARATHVLEYRGDHYRKVATDGYYMGSWLYRREAIERVGGLHSPEVSDKVCDMSFFRRLKESGAEMVNIDACQFAYNWTDEVIHRSWQDRPTLPTITTQGELELIPHFGKDYYNLPIDPGVHAKPFGGVLDQMVGGIF